MEIQIRNLQIDDYKDLYRVWTDPTVEQFALTRKCKTIDDSRIKVERSYFDDYSYSFVALADGEVIGIVTIMQNQSWKMEHNAEVSVMIRNDFQDKGIGKNLFEYILNFADNHLKAKMVQLTCHIDNYKGIHIYEKYGFEKEGIMRNRIFDGKNYKDQDPSANRLGQEGHCRGNRCTTK